MYTRKILSKLGDTLDKRDEYQKMCDKLACYGSSQYTTTARVDFLEASTNICSVKIPARLIIDIVRDHYKELLDDVTSEIESTIIYQNDIL